MANVEDEQTPGPVKGAAGTLERAERNDRGGLKALPREDDEQIDPEEYARLLDSYDSSFRNIAEGEVVKGTVLKVNENEVVVDVGYKSEGVISVNEFLDETGAVMVQPGVFFGVDLVVVIARKGLQPAAITALCAVERSRSALHRTWSLLVFNVCHALRTPLVVARVVRQIRNTPVRVPAFW